MSTTPSMEALKARYDAAGQGHLFTFYPTLAPADQAALLSQLAELDVERVNRIYHKAIESEQGLTKMTTNTVASPEATARADTEVVSPAHPAEKEKPASIGMTISQGVEAVTAAVGGLLSSVTTVKTTPATSAAPANDEIEPLPSSSSASVLDSAEQTATWRRKGLEAVARSQVAVLLMAGGQGTRLGSSAPKGCFDIGLPSHKTLFQYQAERISRLEAVAREEAGGGEIGARARITWFVMTSGPTRAPTEAFFREKAFFGLDEQDVIFFQQGTLPCLSESGEILLASPSAVSEAPDGNGGVYAALRRPISPSDSRTVLSIIAERKIAFIHAYGVDNCLVRVADPTFLGYCIAQGAECGAKVVPKTIPTESVGVVARRGGAFGVVEYTELPQEKAEQRDADGQLSFRAANIANHFYTAEFLERVDSFEPLMAFHIARKKIPTVDLASGAPVKPEKPNGMKLELFVFDVFPFTETLAVLEVERSEEFSPLKNGAGSTSDNAETSRADLLAQQKRWIEAAGATVAAGAEVEISPLVSYAGEGLAALKGFTFGKGGVVETLNAEALQTFA